MFINTDSMMRVAIITHASYTETIRYGKHASVEIHSEPKGKEWPSCVLLCKT